MAFFGAMDLLYVGIHIVPGWLPYQEFAPHRLWGGNMYRVTFWSPNGHLFSIKMLVLDLLTNQECQIKQQLSQKLLTKKDVLIETSG